MQNSVISRKCNRLYLHSLWYWIATTQVETAILEKKAVLIQKSYSAPLLPSSSLPSPLPPPDPAPCSDGDVRLVNGFGPRDGQVEVCYGGIWGSVCSFNWGYNEAAVTCRQLGFNSSGK